MRALEQERMNPIAYVVGGAIIGELFTICMRLGEIADALSRCHP